MTRVRATGYEASPFGAWVRAQPTIESHESGLVVTDIDWCFHKYAPHIDSLGSREVQLMMYVELKCYNATPTPSQLETLALLHQICASKGKVHRPNRPPTTLWHFGVYVLRLLGTSPVQHPQCQWGIFGDDATLHWQTLHTARLVEVLGFTRRPDTLDPLNLRRHHALNAYLAREQTELGFFVDTVVIKRS